MAEEHEVVTETKRINFGETKLGPSAYLEAQREASNVGLPEEEQSSQVAEVEAHVDGEIDMTAPESEEVVADESETEVVESGYNTEMEPNEVEDHSGDYVPAEEGTPQAEAELAETDQVDDNAPLADEQAENAEPRTGEGTDTAFETASLGAESDAGSSVEELKRKQAEIQAEIDKHNQSQKQSVISQIKTVAATYGVTITDLVEAFGGIPRKSKGTKAATKYRDPATGKEWSGRGRAPLWIKDKDYTKFLIVNTTAAV